MDSSLPPDLDQRLKNPSGMRFQLLRGGRVVHHGWITRWQENGVLINVKSPGLVATDQLFDLHAYGHFKKIKVQVKVVAEDESACMMDSPYAGAGLCLGVVGPVTWQEGSEAVRLFLPGHPVTMRQGSHLIEGTSLDAGTHGVAVLVPSVMVVNSPAILRVATPGVAVTSSVIVRSCVRRAKGSYRVGCQLKSSSQLETNTWAEFLETAFGRARYAA